MAAHPPKTPKTKTATTKEASFVTPVKRAKVDWEKVERDYRTDKDTLRELAAKHHTTHTSIARHAEKYGWKKDLTEAIRLATNSALIEQSLHQSCTSAFQDVTNTVLAVASINSQVITKHRVGLNRITRIKELLLDQIEQAAMNMPELAAVIEMVRNPDENGQDKANDALRKAMSRTSLVDDLKKLAEVDERVRKGEREAFSISDGSIDGNPEGRQKRVILEFVDVEAK